VASAAEADFDVALLGWGTRGVDQITVEQLRALGQARDIVVDPGAPPSIFQMLAAYTAPIHDLASLYRDGARKEDVYPAMTAAVLQLAGTRGATVWMTYGHPLVYSMPSRILIRECRARGLRLKVLSGISSIAEIMSVLGLDIAERDLQVTFANHVVSRRRPIDTSVDLLVMQPGALAETTLSRDPAVRRGRDVSAYRLLQEHLERFYPSSHPYTSVCLSDESGVANEVVEAPIARIAELAPAMHYGQTWYIRALPDAASPTVEAGASHDAPAAVARITEAADAAGIYYGSDARTGELLRALAASKPGGALLELGTGIGLGAAWLLAGMDAGARLTSVDIQEAGGIARRCLSDDPRLELVTKDATDVLADRGGRRFDLIFADAPPGKFSDVDRALDALAPGGLYVTDDMDPQQHDPERAPLLARLLASLRAREDLVLTELRWGTGLLVATRRG
jgi:predicted O-methyltransferase YrrM/precorrin-2 methylase